MVGVMTNRMRRRLWVKLAAGLLFAVVAYGVMYAAAMTPRRVLINGVVEDDGVFSSCPYAVTPQFSTPLPPRIASAFFALAHWADRRIRPHVWGDGHSMATSQGSVETRSWLVPR